MTKVPDDINSKKKKEFQQYIEQLHDQIDSLEGQLEETERKNLQKGVDEVRDDVEKLEKVEDHLKHDAENKLREVEASLSRLQKKINQTDTGNQGNLSTSVQDTVSDITGNDDS